MPKTTKEAIQQTLYELLQTRALDEITVTELVERCGISRQGFYYHFSDLYGVVEWTMQQTLARLQAAGPEEWWSGMRGAMAKMHQNRTVVLNVYRAYERSYVEYNLHRLLLPFIRTKVEASACRYAVSSGQRQFVEEMCALALANITLSWMDRGMNSQFAERLDDFYDIMEGSLDFMLSRLAQRNRTFSPEE